MFNSSISKSKSVNLLNKLTNNLTSNSVTTSENNPKSSKSSTQKLLTELNKKVIKKKVNKSINKKSIIDAKNLKRINYEIIKSKSNHGKLNENHEKYLKKLIKKNKRLLLNNDEYDDDLEDLQNDILNYEKKTVKKDKSFKEQKFPGLTPGLAPVGYESDDEEE